MDNSKLYTWLVGFVCGATFVFIMWSMFTPEEEVNTQQAINGQPQQPKVIDTLQVNQFMTADQLQVGVVLVGSVDEQDLFKAKLQLREQIAEHSFWWLHKYAVDSLDIAKYKVVKPMFDERTEEIIADFYTTQANHERAKKDLEFQKIMADQSKEMVDHIVDSTNNAKKVPE